MSQNDILIEPDLVVKDGDIFIGPADDNNSLYISFAQKGQLRRNPLLGVGILSFTNAPDQSGRDLAKAIRAEHDRDGYRLTTLQIEPLENGGQELSIRAVKIRN